MSAPEKKRHASSPVEYDSDTLNAVAALRAGVASQAQQLSAIKWIELVACDVEGMSFHEESDRATAFHEGRRFVGNQIRKMSNPIARAAKQKPETDTEARGKK